MKPTEISEIIRLASNLSVLLPLVAYLSKIRYASKRIHIIGVLVIACGVCDLVSFMMLREKQSTVVLMNTYYLLTFLILLWFYYEIVFIKSRRVIVWVGLAVYLQSLLLITLFVQPFDTYQTLMWVITAIVLIVFSIEYFLYLLAARPSINLMNYTTMWINSGVLTYFGFNLFLFVMSNYVFTQLDRETSAVLWSFHNVNNIIKNILFCIGISLHRKKLAEF